MTRLEAPIGSGKNSGLQTILNFATPVANKVKERNTSSISNMYTAKQINSSPYMENSLNLGADITSEDYELAEATEIPKETSPDGSRSPEIQMAGYYFKYQANIFLGYAVENSFGEVICRSCFVQLIWR